MDFFVKLFKLPELRNRFLFTLFLIIIYRLGSHIPISGIDIVRLQSELFSQRGFLGFVNLFSGGGLSRFSLFALGILPYINSSILIQFLTPLPLFTLVVPVVCSPIVFTTELLGMSL